jgi:hypothetical protein
LADGHANHRHRVAGGCLRPLLHVTCRSRTPLLLTPARFHGRDARHRALGQSDTAGFLLGTNQPLFFPADRLLVPNRAGARRRPYGTDHYGVGRTLPIRRSTDTRPYRRQLRPRSGARVRRRDPVAFALRPRACPHSSRCADKERAVSFSFLAATRHGSPHASFGLPALRYNGQSRRWEGPTSGCGSSARPV